MSVEIKHLKKKYKNKVIFDDFNFYFDKGKIYGISAPSGYGKTTLLNMIAGLERDYEGDIKVKGEVAYVFQEDRLFPYMSVMENILFVKEEKNLKKAKFLLKSVNLYEQKNLYPKELSGGMKMRVSIARALYYESDIILFDEAFAGIDNALTDKILDYIDEIKKDKTILLVSHNENLLENKTDVIVRLDNLGDI